MQSATAVATGREARQSRAAEIGKASEGHLYAIDFARGIAALIVLVWHYQHFFIIRAGAEALSIGRTDQPLYWLFWPFYEYGFYAVQFFWMISGFVFTAVYLPRPVDARDFVVNRVARLYPLHLLTLVAVAILQVASLRLTGHEQIYAHNDLKHFVLNLLFASHWGLEAGYSFNGPIWSVSIEVLVYGVFFLLLPRLFKFGFWGPALLAAVFWVIHYHSPLRHDEDFGRCMFYFFEGSALYLIAQSMKDRPLIVTGTATVLTFLGLVVFAIRPHSIDSVGMPLLLTGLLLFFTVIEAADTQRIFHRLRWIGDNTYGTYLWHVPIQILTLIVLDRVAEDHRVALQPWFLITFLIVTTIVARLSFNLIEAPARRHIRSRLQGPPQA